MSHDGQACASTAMAYLMHSVTAATIAGGGGNRASLASKTWRQAEPPTKLSSGDEVWTPTLPAVEKLDDLFDPAGRPHNNKVVTRFDPELWLRGREGFVASKHRDD